MYLFKKNISISRHFDSGNDISNFSLKKRCNSADKGYDARAVLKVQRRDQDDVKKAE